MPHSITLSPCSCVSCDSHCLCRSMCSIRLGMGEPQQLVACRSIWACCACHSGQLCEACQRWCIQGDDLQQGGTQSPQLMPHSFPGGACIPSHCLYWRPLWLHSAHPASSILAAFDLLEHAHLGCIRRERQCTHCIQQSSSPASRQIHHETMIVHPVDITGDHSRDLQVLPGEYIEAGRQGSPRLGEVKPPTDLAPNNELLDAQSFRSDCQVVWALRCSLQAVLRRVIEAAGGVSRANIADICCEHL